MNEKWSISIHLGLCICVCSKDSILELINNHLKLSVTLWNIIYVMQRLDALRPWAWSNIRNWLIWVVQLKSLELKTDIRCANTIYSSTLSKFHTKIINLNHKLIKKKIISKYIPENHQLLKGAIQRPVWPKHPPNL